MKINGLKHLNSNFYDYIMIRNKKDEITIEVKNSVNVPTTKNNKTFYSTIKNLDEKEKTTEIIRYYLRNNNINKIYKGGLAHYDGNFMIIEGNRNLYLQIDKEQVDINILNEITAKYQFDRLKYLTKKELKNIEITSSPYSGFEYGYYKNPDNYDEYTFINLHKKNNEIIDFEKKFFIDYINYLISQTDEVIQMNSVSYNYRYFNYYNRKFEDQGGHYFKCDKFSLRLDKDLFLIAYHLITNHNKSIIETKKLQLKFFG